MTTPHQLFLLWEPHLAEIISRYPEPSNIFCSGRAPSTVRQNLQQALNILCANPHFSSVIPHDQALLVQRAFVWGTNDDGSVYVGPRRSRKAGGKVLVATEGQANPTLNLPTIDCSNPVTLNAILHLKNFDHITIPITISNAQIPDDLNLNYPNVEIIPNPDSTLTIL